MSEAPHNMVAGLRGPSRNKFGMKIPNLQRLTGLLLLLSGLCLAQPQGRYLMVRANGKPSGNYIEFRGDEVIYNDFNGMEERHGRLEKGGRAFALGKDRIRLFELAEDRLLLEPESKTKVVFAEKVKDIPPQFRGEWLDSEDKLVNVGSNSVLWDQSLRVQYKLNWNDPVLEIEFLTSKYKGPISILRVSPNELLAWDESGRKRRLRRSQASSLDFSTPETLWQAFQDSVRSQNPSQFLDCFHPSERDYENVKRELKQPGRFERYVSGPKGSGILRARLRNVELNGDKAEIFLENGPKEAVDAVKREGRWYLVGL